MESIESGATPATGIFITLEGPDGAGKSSQQGLLVERLMRTGREVVATREPGGTPLGERIRSILLELETAHDPMVDALLFNAARRALVDEVVRPALARGAVVICDQFSNSTLAYQGYGSGAPIADLVSLATVATSGLQPTRTILLDLSVGVGLGRRQGGPAAELTRFETRQDHNRDFHQRVRDGYLQLAAADPGRWRVVTASGAREEVASLVWQALRDLFENG